MQPSDWRILRKRLQATELLQELHDDDKEKLLAFCVDIQTRFGEVGFIDLTTHLWLQINVSISRKVNKDTTCISGEQ